MKEGEILKRKFFVGRWENNCRFLTARRKKFFGTKSPAFFTGETLNFYKSLQIDLDFLPDSYPDHFMCFMPRKFLYLLYSMIFELRFDSNLDSKSVYRHSSIYAVNLGIQK